MSTEGRGGLVAALCVALTLWGCGNRRAPAYADSGPGDGGKPTGSEGGPCYPGGFCNQGLTCQGGVCVRAPSDAAPDRRRDLPPLYPDGAPLWPCDTPGQPCNSHDPCAIDPICGQDLLCHPTGYQNCDDGLACTMDVCKGMGLCDFLPQAGTCALPVKVGGTSEIKCFMQGELSPNDPCLVCDPDISATAWSPANGGACDDGQACTKDDTCQAGVCKGTYYGSVCDDGLGCTDDLCDGVGGCLGSKVKAGWCLINGACYPDQALHPSGVCLICDVSKSTGQWTPIADACQIGGACYPAGTPHPDGCALCDPNSSTTAWTVVGQSCLVNNTCYPSGAKDASGCGTCDPTQSKTSFTPLPNVCLIGGVCYQDQQQHPATACLVCDVSQDPTGWTPVANVQLVAHNFESGAATGWSLVNSDAVVGWQVSDKRAASGSYALYYGDPAKGNFDSSSTNKGTATMPSVTLAAGKAGLSFMLYMDTESGTTYDKLEIRVGGTTVWQKTSPTVKMKSWQPITVDLSAYAGKLSTIEFVFDTVDSVANQGEGVYIDDVVVYHGC